MGACPCSRSTPTVAMLVVIEMQGSKRCRTWRRPRSGTNHLILGAVYKIRHTPGGGAPTYSTLRYHLVPDLFRRGGFSLRGPVHNKMRFRGWKGLLLSGCTHYVSVSVRDVAISTKSINQHIFFSNLLRSVNIFDTVPSLLEKC